MYGIGRRKTAIAQVFLSEAEIVEGEIQVNGLSLADYFQSPQTALQNFLFEFNKSLQVSGGGFNKSVKVKVSGGGQTSQKEAIRLALARAFCKIDPTFKKPNLLTQDSRIKERKKYGLKKARKAPQYSKR